MGKPFGQFFNDILDEYADAKNKTIPGVDKSHYIRQLRNKLKQDTMHWFFLHIDTIAGNKEEIKKTLSQDKLEEPKPMHPPTDFTGLPQ